MKTNKKMNKNKQAREKNHFEFVFCSRKIRTQEMWHNII